MTQWDDIPRLDQNTSATLRSPSWKPHICDFMMMAMVMVMVVIGDIVIINVANTPCNSTFKLWEGCET